MVISKLILRWVCEMGTFFVYYFWKLVKYFKHQESIKLAMSLRRIFSCECGEAKVVGNLPSLNYVLWNTRSLNKQVILYSLWEVEICKVKVRIILKLHNNFGAIHYHKATVIEALAKQTIWKYRSLKHKKIAFSKYSKVFNCLCLSSLKKLIIQLTVVLP